jgi:hypothetical protein
MDNLDKKSNKDLLDLKYRLSKDFETIRMELLRKQEHWDAVKEAYNKVNNELRKRNVV